MSEINWIKCCDELPPLQTNILLLTPLGIFQVKREEFSNMKGSVITYKQYYKPSCFYDLNKRIEEKDAIYWCHINLPKD